MHRVLFMSLDAAIAGLIMAPIFWILNKRVFHNKVSSVLYFLFAVYLSGMFAVVGLPDIRYIRFDPRFNFVLFAYMFSDFTNSLLNVFLFLPMGFFLPVLWRNFLPVWKTLLFGFATSLFIELLQIFTLRATDVNDLITNSAGTLIGWCIGRILLHSNHAVVPGASVKDAYWVCGTAFCVMFFIHPYVTELIRIIL